MENKKMESRKIIDIKFRGIDDFNRPVYKDIKSNTYFGSTEKLFSNDTPTKEINDYFSGNLENMDKLELFGYKFNCEPIGGFNHEKFVLNILN